MSFIATDPQSRQGENTWFTPKFLIDALGPFDLDPCTVSYRPFDTAKEHIERDMGGDAFKRDWQGDVWLNPPYGKEIGPFVEMFMFHRMGVMLIFARMDSAPIQRLVKDGAFLFCLRKRVKFIQKDGAPVTNAGTGSVLVF
jgi:hypothetical protein